MMSLPLSNRVIALAEGRQLEELASMLEKEGATALRCPLLSILDAPDDAPLVAWLKELIADRVVDLIERMAKGGIDAVVFTSSPQVDRLFEVAQERGKQEQLRQGLERAQVAAVGPIVADNLRQRGVTVAICPEQGFVMKNLV